MPAPDLRPRSPSEIVDAAFQILRAHYAAFITCSAIAYAPLLLFRLFAVGDPSRFLDPESATRQPDLWRLAGGSFLITWLTFSLMSAVIQACAAQVYLGGDIDVGAAVRQALPRAPQVLGAAVIRFVLMVVAFVALVFPVLYVVARYFAVTPIIVLEGRGVSDALRRSAELSTGRKWHILNTLGLVAIIYYVLVFGFSVVASLAGFVASTVVAAVVTVLVYPVVAITEAVLYYDARIQSEGLDIELMLSALDSPPARAA